VIFRARGQQAEPIPRLAGFPEGDAYFAAMSRRLLATAPSSTFAPIDDADWKSWSAMWASADPNRERGLQNVSVTSANANARPHKSCRAAMQASQGKTNAARAALEDQKIAPALPRDPPTPA
jgi:hypothetical protein